MMNKNRDYAFKVYKGEFGDWVCAYLDIPGLIGVGDTKIEAIQEAEIFLNLYLDQLDSENKEYPIINDSYTYSGRITLRVAKSTHRHIVEAAQKDEVSINQWVTDAVNEKFGVWKAHDKILQALESISEVAVFEKNNKNHLHQTIRALYDDSSMRAYYSEGKSYGK